MRNLDLFDDDLEADEAAIKPRAEPSNTVIIHMEDFDSGNATLFKSAITRIGHAYGRHIKFRKGRAED
jgi:hypothetical protein